MVNTNVYVPIELTIDTQLKLQQVFDMRQIIQIQISTNKLKAT